jgi:hypothetical protein
MLLKEWALRTIYSYAFQLVILLGIKLWKRNCIDNIELHRCRIISHSTYVLCGIESKCAIWNWKQRQEVREERRWVLYVWWGAKETVEHLMIEFEAYEKRGYDWDNFIIDESKTWERMTSHSHNRLQSGENDLTIPSTNHNLEWMTLQSSIV